MSVLVLPSGSMGQRATEIAEAWYAAGLLDAALWVHPEDVWAEPGAAPRVTALLRTPRGTESGDLFTLLGDRRLDLVRLVMLQVIDDAGSVDELQIRGGAAVRESIARSLPGPRRDSAGVVTPGTKLRTINLLTGATGLSEVTRELLPPGWDIAAVTSPEDRPDPSRANAFVRSDSADPNLLPVAMLSAGVVAAILPGPLDGPFDTTDGDESTVLGKARVIRSTVRVLLGDEAMRDLAILARRRALGPDAQGVIEPERFGVVQRSSDHVLELLAWLDTVDGGVAVPTASAPDDTVRREVTIKRGIQTFAAFASRAIVVMLWSLVRLMRRGAESMATRAIVGERAGVSLVLKPDVSTQLAGELEDLENEDLRFWADVIEKVERRPVRMPTQELWGQLREVSHDVIDGGTLPQGAPRPMEGSRPLLLSRVDDVVPHPQDAFTLPPEVSLESGEQEVSACAPAEVRAARELLTEARGRAEHGVAAARQSVSAASSQAASPPSTDEPRGEPVENARRVLAEAQTALGRVQRVERDFAQWLERRNRSLLWVFRESNLERLGQAASREAASRHAVGAASGLDRGRLDKLRRRFLVWSWSTVLVTGLITLVLTLTAGDRDADLLRELPIVATAGTVLLVVLIRRWYQGVLRYLHAYEQAARARARAAADFEVQHADRRRFEAIEAGLEEWVDILGWSLHTPWTDEVADEDDEAEVVERALPLPAALRLGAPTLDERTADAAAGNAARTLTYPAWRGRSYGRLLACHLGDCDDGEEVSVERLDSDQVQRHRREFRQALGEGRPQAEAAALVKKELEEILRRDRLCVERLSVRDTRAAEAGNEPLPDAVFLAQALVPASHLATETWSEKAQSHGAHEKLRTHVWTRQSMASATTSPADALLTTYPDDALAGSTLLDVVVRVDVSQWLDLSELRLFGRAPSQEEGSWQSSGSDDAFR